MNKGRQTFIILAACAALSLIQGCGGYNNGTTTTPPPVTLPTAAKRAFVVNKFNNVVDVIDSAHDIPTGASLGVNNDSDLIVVMSNKKSIVHAATGSIVQLDDAMESVDGTINSFPAATESIVPSQDGLSAYAAIPSIGKVSKMDFTTAAVTSIPADPAVLPGVRHLAITHNGNTILAFSDNNDTVTFIDRTNSDAVSTPVAGFDRPFTALLSADDSTAYVLNCGAECGGTQASIAVLNMTTKTITRTVPVRAATVAVMDTANIYVAGTDPTTNLGRLDVVNLTTFAVTPVAMPISDGKHTTMALAANSKLYIGSKACSNSGGKCLSVFNTGSGSVTIPAATVANPNLGDVTAITPIVGRTVVYVIQNGLLTIYDTSTDSPQAVQIVIVGAVSDVKEVDN